MALPSFYTLLRREFFTVRNPNCGIIEIDPTREDDCEEASNLEGL